jgi:hypothetical protein
MRQVRSIFVLAIVLMAAGAVLTLENMRIISGASKQWPAFLIILGIGFEILFFERKRNDLAILWLGTALILLGIFFFYLNYTSWMKMVKLWPLFLEIAGASFFVLYVKGRISIFLFLAVALLMLGAVFYLVFGVSLMLWPLSLVAFGISLLLVNHYYLRG